MERLKDIVAIFPLLSLFIISCLLFSMRCEADVIVQSNPESSDNGSIYKNPDNKTVVVTLPPGKPKSTEPSSPRDDPRGRGDNEKKSPDVENLFCLTNSFLDFVQPYAKGHILQKISFAANDTEDITEEIYKERLLFLGFYVCIFVCVGLALIVIIWGFTYCFCKVCHCCEPEPSEDPYGIYMTEKRCCPKWGIICTAVFILLLACAVLITAIGIAVMNGRLQKQTRGDDNISEQLIDDVDALETFINSTVDQIKALRENTVHNVTTEVDQTNAELDVLSDRIMDQVETDTQINAVFSEAYELANRTKLIQSIGKQLNSTLQNFIVQSEKLEEDVSGVKQRILDFIGRIPAEYCDSECEEAKNTASSWGLTSTFTMVKERYLQDLNSELASTRAHLNWDVDAEVHKAEGPYEVLVADVRNTTSEEVVSVKMQLDAAKLAIANISQDVLDGLEDMVSESHALCEDVRREIITKTEYVNNTGVAILIVTIIVFVILVLIVLCNLMSSCCGLCREMNICYCEKGGMHKKTTNCAIACEFIFFVIFIILVVSLFAVGGLFQTQVCRYVVGLNSNPHFSVVDEILDKVPEVDKALNNLKKNTTFNVTFGKVLADCEADVPLYRAVEIEKFYSLDEILDEDEYRRGFDEILDEFLGGNFLNFDHIDDYAESIKDLFTDLPDHKQLLDNVTLFREKLQAEQILTLEVDDMSQKMNDYSEKLRTNKPDMADDLKKLADEVRVLHMTSYEPVLMANTTLNSLLLQLEEELSRVPSLNDLAGQLQGSINISLDLVKTKAEDVVKKSVRTFAEPKLDFALGLIVEVKHQVKQEVGRCRPLYNILDNMVNQVCIQTVYPLNGFWFCLGLATLLFIPLLILDICLVRMYHNDTRAGGSRLGRGRYGSDRGYAEVHYTLKEEQRMSLLELNK